MMRKSFTILSIVLCLGLILTGCPKKTVVKEEPSVSSAEEAKRIEAEKVAKEREAREREAKEKEAREKEAREREAKQKEEEARKAKEKEFEKSLVSKKQPGIEGEVFESGMLKDIFFDFDKYDIRLADVETLKQNGDLLKKSPRVKIQIEGHCDERGTNEYNLALGERRANSTRKYLVSLGIPADRISAISYGEERPLDPEHNEAAWAKNRRAHFVILSK